MKKNNQNILLQSIYKNNEGEELKKNENPLIIKFSHQILNNSKIHFNVFQYINIRLINGSFLPIWNISPQKYHDKWETDCLVIPYHLKMQNILVVVGKEKLKKFKKKFSLGEDNVKENSGDVLIKDIEIFQSSTKSTSELFQKFSNSCTRIKTLTRSVDSYKVEVEKYKSKERIVSI